MKTCAHPGCDLKHYAKGYCRAHYLRDLRGDDMDKPVRRRRLKGQSKDKCAHPGCTNLEAGYLSRMCARHELRRKEGRPMDGPRYYRESLGYTDEAGYRRISIDGRRAVLEHRYFMEQKLGRRLHRYENVHHKNGVKTDNRLDNLELWVKAQPCGQRVEDLVAWVISEYPDEVRKALEAT